MFLKRNDKTLKERKKAASAREGTQTETKKELKNIVFHALLNARSKKNLRLHHHKSTFKRASKVSKLVKKLKCGKQ